MFLCIWPLLAMNKKVIEMNIFPKLLLGCLLILFQAALFAKEFTKELYSQQQAVAILGQQKVLTELDSFKNNKSTSLRISKINSWLSNSTLEPLVKEKLLYEATLIIRAEPVTTVYQQVMKKLLSYQSTAYLPLSDGGYTLEIVAFQVAASAKATLIHWQIQQSYSRANLALATAPELFADQLGQFSDRAVMLGYIKAIEQTEASQLEPLINTIKINQQLLPTRVLMAIATKTADRGLYQMMIEQYQHSETDQSLLIQNLSSLPDSITDFEKIQLLKLASTKNGLGDAAVLALSDFVDGFPQVRELLMARLADPQTGGAAAKALSSSQDPMVLDILASNLTATDSLTKRRSLLALYLNGSFQATSSLQAFHDSTTDQQLKREVSQWLR